MKVMFLIRIFLVAVAKEFFQTFLVVWGMRPYW